MREETEAVRFVKEMLMERGGGEDRERRVEWYEEYGFK